jgi:putative DNA primase/helicase
MHRTNKLHFSAAEIERARTVKIQDEVARRGGKVKRQSRNYLVGPCLVCGGDDRFVINIKENFWNCRVCRVGGDIIDFVRHVDGCDFVIAITTLLGEGIRNQSPPAKRQVYKDDQDNASTAAWLWLQRKPITEGTPPGLYLRKRKYTGPIPATLAYVPPRGPHPAAMIAPFGIATELNEPGIIGVPKSVAGVHLTRLTVVGNKAPNAQGKAKIMLGACMGKPITISPPNDLLGIAVTEGIEDALSVYQGTGLGVWAAGSAVFMPALAPLVPDYIETVTVYAHDDTGRSYAIDLARALKARGIEVLVQGL